jgi:hypothetical protein
MLLLFERYLDLFDLPINKSFINFDVSTRYFTDPKVPIRVHTLINEAKIVIAIRDPVERAYSFYLVNYCANMIICQFSLLLVLIDVNSRDFFP